MNKYELKTVIYTTSKSFWMEKDFASIIESISLSNGINVKPFVNGNDLIALGIKPGPIYKQILGIVEDSQLNGEVKTKGQAIDLALSIAYK